MRARAGRPRPGGRRTGPRWADPASMHAHSADALLQTALGFRAAQALLCAVELGLFGELARGPRTMRQMRRALGLSERAAPDLLDALVAMGVLDREGDDAQAVYLNTRAASRYLDRRS